MHDGKCLSLSCRQGSTRLTGIRFKQLEEAKECGGDSGKAESGSELNLTIQVPYMFSTINTIVTYLFHTFCARKPMFQVNTYKQETMKSAQTIETVLQYNADAKRLIKQLYKFLWDGQVYGGYTAYSMA